MDMATKPSLASRINALAASSREPGGATTDAKAVLDELRQDYPEFDKVIAQKFARFPTAHQQRILTLLQDAQAREYAPLVQRWSHDPALSLQTRVQALVTQEQLALSIDSSYRDTILQAEQVRHHLATSEPAPLTDTGTLQTPWDEIVRTLPLNLVLDVAHDLAPIRPAAAFATLQTIYPHIQPSQYPLLVESLAGIPVPESVALLQALGAETTEKALQKAIKRALHRLKVQGVTVTDTPRAHVVIGTGSHRLERCLASFIDGTGERMVLMIRTKAGGGYNIAYLVLNYGLGIRHALGMQVSKRELPDLLAKAQERSRLIDLDPAYCQYQVALGHQMNLATGTPVPEEYFSLRDIIGESDTTFDQALIYSVLSPQDLEAAKAYTAHAADLLELPEFAGWTLPEPIIQKYGDALEATESSQIVVSPTMQQERINTVYEQAMTEVLGEQSRRLMRLRLEEMAYYLLQTDRHLEALWAVAAAQSLLADDPHRLRNNPFAGALLERSLAFAKRRPSSRIVLPFSRPSSPEEPRLII